MRTLYHPSHHAQTADALPLSGPIFTWLAAALTLAILPHLSHLPGWFWPVFPGAVGWSGLVDRGRLALPPRWLLAVITLVTVAVVLVYHHTLFGRDAGTTLLAAMVSLKFLELRTPRDGMVLIFLGYFLVMAILLYDQSLLLTAYLLASLVVLLAAQVALQHPAALPPLSLLRLTSRQLLEAIPLLLILFILFPRISGPLWGLPKDAYSGLSGLSEEMTPGSISQLSLSASVAFRVRFNGPIPPPEQLYWRELVLWRYDGHTWRRTEESSSPQFSYQVEGRAVDYAIILEPHGKRWLPALELPASLPANTGITPSLQLMRNQAVNELLRYELRSYPRYNTGPLQLQGQTSLPARLNPRARALAEQWQARYPNPVDSVRAALTLFREEPFHYTLKPPLLQDKNAIDEFLFDSRRGFCEHYAGSFVFLMRAAGIPARVVLGYQGGERNELGGYLIVRQSDAHAWAEVWLEGRGWVRVDPTAAVAPERVERGLYAALEDPNALPLLIRRGSPWLHNLLLSWDYLNNAWNEWVLAYGPERQQQFLSGLGFGPVDWRGMTIALVVVLTGVGLLVVGFHTLNRRTAIDPVTLAYQRFCAKLARTGLGRAPHEGPLAFTERVAVCRPELAARVRLIGRLYANLRYGRWQQPEAVRRLQRLVRELKV
jgi:transglutaminase-like putative cysteine protease